MFSVPIAATDAMNGKRLHIGGLVKPKTPRQLAQAFLAWTAPKAGLVSRCRCLGLWRGR